MKRKRSPDDNSSTNNTTSTEHNSGDGGDTAATITPTRDAYFASIFIDIKSEEEEEEQQPGSEINNNGRQEFTHNWLAALPDLAFVALCQYLIQPLNQFYQNLISLHSCKDLLALSQTCHALHSCVFGVHAQLPWILNQRALICSAFTQQISEARNIAFKHNFDDMATVLLPFLFPKLERLVFYGKTVTDITPLMRLTHLKTLNIACPRLLSLPSRLGESLTRLTNLGIHDATCSNLMSIVSHISTLKYLKISGHVEPTQFTSNDAFPPSLQQLGIRDMSFKTVPESIMQLTNLITLELPATELESLPETLGRMTSLTRLDLSNNPIKSGLEAISALTNLRYLDLAACKLTALPSLPTDIEELYLSDNQLTALPVGNEIMSELRVLHIDNNRDLPSLPADIDTRWPQLEELSIVGDIAIVRNLPIAITKLQYLVEIKVCQQALDFVSKASLKKLLTHRWPTTTPSPSSTIHAQVRQVARILLILKADPSFSLSIYPS